MPMGLQRRGDERKSGRQRKTTPRQKKKHSRDDSGPMRNAENQRVTDDGNEVESEKRAAMSPTIDNYAAGIGVDRAQQCPERVIQADDENAGAEREKIFGDKTHPEFFPRANDEYGD